MLRNFLHFVWLLAFICLSANVARAQVIASSAAMHRWLPLEGALVSYVDSSRALAWTEVREQPFAERPLPAPADVRHRYWLRFELQRPADTLKLRARLWLPTSDFITIYTPVEGAAPVHAGRFNGRHTVSTRNDGMLLAELPDSLIASGSYYISIENITRWGVHTFHNDLYWYLGTEASSMPNLPSKVLYEDLLFQVFLGLLFGLGLYFLLTYFFNKWLPFLRYSFYLGVMFVYFINKTVDLQILMPMLHPKLGFIVNDVTMVLTSIFYTSFVSAYLDIKRQYPRLYPYVVTYYVVLAVGLLGYLGVLTFAPHNPIHLHFFTYELLFVTFFSIGLLVYIMWKGVSGTGWVVIAGSFLLIAGNATAMLGGNFLLITPFMTVEVLLFALGLSYQIRLNDLERIRTREQLIEQLRVNEQLQQEMQQKLEAEVELQTERAITMTQKAEVEKAERLHSELLNELEQVRMKALQAQMNPHFIFNCLNSIRLYYMNRDLEKADDYITKFAKLIRLILNFSRKNEVSLQEELDALRLYLEFEQMRFKRQFTFEIQVSTQIQPTKIAFPALLLQPFVENAIWHGLMHLQSRGKVTVKVEPHVPEPTTDEGAHSPKGTLQALKITITDNGIGRQRAKQLQPQTSSHKRSYGLAIIEERIALYNRSNNKNTTYEILDCYDEVGEPCGTSVQIIYDL